MTVFRKWLHKCWGCVRLGFGYNVSERSLKADNQDKGSLNIVGLNVCWLLSAFSRYHFDALTVWQTRQIHSSSAPLLSKQCSFRLQNTKMVMAKIPPLRLQHSSPPHNDVRMATTTHSTKFSTDDMSW